jgi:hypothetical protein
MRGGISFLQNFSLIFKNPVHTSKRTPHFTITKIKWLTLFKEIKVKMSRYTPWKRRGEEV